MNNLIKKDMIAYFNKMAPDWSSVHSDRTKRIASEAVRRIGIRQDDRILDVGAGAGILIPFLQYNGIPDYLGIEISMGMIDSFKAQHPHMNILYCDFEEECDLLKSFDTIIVFDTLHLMTNLNMILKNAMHHLENGGRFIAFQSRTRASMLGWQKNQQSRSKRSLLPDDSAILELCAPLGFTITEISDNRYFYMELLAGKQPKS